MSLPRPGSEPDRSLEAAPQNPSATAGPRRRLILASWCVGLVTLVLMLASEPYLAIVWDEGYTLGREARLRLWFSALKDPVRFAADWQPPREELVQQVGASPPRPDQIDTRAELLFNPQVLAWFWPFAREEPHGHPPFYALLGLVGDLIAPTWQDLPRARLGPILLFSLAAMALFHFVAARWGGWAAIVSASAWVLQPNLFGHGHYAAYDAVLTSLWALAIVSFAWAEHSRWPRLVFGAILGCALSTKLTGWFLPVPFLVWSLLVRDRRFLATLAIGLPVAGAVLFLLNPPWWTEPITGVVRFLRSNLTRGQTIPIPVQFLGTVYQTPNQSLPWYNTLVWTAFVTPVGFLVFGLLGVFSALRRARSELLGVLVLGHWGLLMGLRALPHTPGHDGVRLFLPALGVFSILVGIGAGRLIQRYGSWVKWAIGGALTEGVVSLLVMMPVPLSYFSPVVGGLPGATRLGMEPTYYWDALGKDAQAWLRANTHSGETIRFATFPHSWLYLRRTGDLPPRLAPIDSGRPVWYVLQHRPGAWTSLDRALVAQATPAFTVRKLDVTLVWIFSYRDVERLTANGPLP